MLLGDFSNGSTPVERVAKLLVFERCPWFASIGWAGAVRDVHPALLNAALECQGSRAKCANNVGVLQPRVCRKLLARNRIAPIREGLNYAAGFVWRHGFGSVIFGSVDGKLSPK